MTVTRTIEEQVKAQLAAAFATDADALAPEASLRDDLGADSLALVEALHGLEERLGILLPDADSFLLDLATVGDVVRAFAARAAEEPAR
jgi:acyl carrier protein